MTDNPEDRGSPTLASEGSGSGISVHSGPILSGGCFVTGLQEDEATGCLRVYVGPRYEGIYALVEDEAAKTAFRREWSRSFSGHLMIQVPPSDCLYQDESATHPSQSLGSGSDLPDPPAVARVEGTQRND